MSETRFLNLTNATTGQIRTATYQGREHLVVPVVALMEGVIFPVNAAHPELVLASEFSAAPQGWNGRPLFLNHPAANGVQISGNSPKVLESAIGQVFNARISGKRLLMEAWIDTAKARALGAMGESLVARAAAGKPVEVSVGVFVVTEAKIGDYNGKQYKAIWHDVVPDHLALLPDGVLGACSYEMGCGIRAAVANDMSGEEPTMDLKAARDIPQSERDQHPHSDFAGPGTSFPIIKPEDVAAAAHAIGRAKGDPEAIKARIIEIAYRKGDAFVAQLPEAWKRDGEQKNAEARAALEALEANLDSPDADTALAAATTILALAGKRHSSKDEELVQGLHDYSVKLGATCDYASASNKPMALHEKMYPKTAEQHMEQVLEFHALTALVEPTVLEGAPTNDKEEHPFTYCRETIIPAIEAKGKAISDPEAFCGWWKAQQKNAEGRAAELKAAASKCKCHHNHGGEADMDKKTRVKTLVGNAYSPFSEADIPMLEGIGDDRLEAFETAAETRAAADKTAQADLKTAKDAQVKAETEVQSLKAAAEAVLPEDKWLERAPARVRSLVEDAQKAEQAKRDQLVDQLKTAQSVYSEEELKALSTEHLQKLGAVAIKTAEEKAPVNFTGRGILPKNEDNKVPAAPDMNAAIRTARAAAK